MFNLLNKINNRRLEFARILSEKENWIKLEELANILGCSDRILKEDIVFFKKKFTDFTIETSTYGVRLRFNYNKGLKSLYQKMLTGSTSYQLLETIFFYEDKTILELANKLYVSESTLYRLVNQINTHLDKYDINILTNPCRVVGNEKHIRYFYYQYFAEKYSRLEWPYEIVDEEAFDQLLMFFINFTKIKADSAHYNIFKLTSAVNFIRFEKHHFIDIDDVQINFDEIIPQLSDFSDVLQEIEDALRVTFDNHLIHQVFSPYVQEGYSLNFERLIEKTRTNPKKKKEIDFLTELLDEISEKNNISIPNKEDIILALDNSAHLEYQEPQSGYILYNKHKFFTRAIYKEFPNFYTQLYEAMSKYRELLNKPMTKDGIRFYIYTLFTSWENLVQDLWKNLKKIKVLVISDRHVSHAKMLKDFITYEFGDQLIIEIHTSIDLSLSTLENSDCDFIVTNASIPTDLDKLVIYIEKFPTHHDIQKIQNAIKVVLSKE